MTDLLSVIERRPRDHETRPHHRWRIIHPASPVGAGEATSREITAAVHEEVTDPKMASVQKLIERLEAKGCVRRDRSERAHRFRPLVSHEQFLRSRLQAWPTGSAKGRWFPW